MNHFVPQPVIRIIDALTRAGFEAFLVGGCVRDLLLSREPKDWDITTNAKPEEVLSLFPDSFYENDFGTVGVKTDAFLPSGRPDREHDIVEVTTYRKESAYSDRRRPDEVSFVSTIGEDLARRDFTMNAVAASIDRSSAGSDRQGASEDVVQGGIDISLSFVDPFGGRDDIGKKIIRAVGEADARFGEDALRMMRAIRLYAELVEKGDYQRTSSASISDWAIEEGTLQAIRNHASSIGHVSFERIRDEFSRIILSGHPAEGVDLLQKTGLLKHIIPELEEGVGVGQNLHHIYTVWEHNLRALATCPSKDLAVRLAALLHDVGKPRTKKGDGLHSTFYNHDHVGARMVRPLLRRLRYSVDIVEKTTLLVDNHLFYYNVGEVSEASVRRLIRKVGLENMRDLMDVRIADRLGSGVPKAKPYKLRHLEYMIDKVSKDPVSVKMLAIHGNDLMEMLGMQPGPKIGAILDVLLAEVIEDPERNVKDALLARARELDQEDLASLRNQAKEAIEERREEDDRDIKKRHWVE